MSAARDALCLTHVRILIGTRMLVDSLDLRVEAGGCATVVGPAGSGKSALLAWIAGTPDPELRARGRVSIGGDEIASLPLERRRIGILFADDLLFPHLTVAGNLAFALPPGVRGRDARRTMAERMLGEAGLAGSGDHYPEALAAGQRARVALMRALAAEPRALLLDDPFGSLDPQLRADVRRFVFEQAASRGLPTLLVTRDVADARAAGGPVILLSADAVPPTSTPASTSTPAPAVQAPDVVEEARPRVRRA